MNRNAINRVLKRKHEDFLQSIDDEMVRNCIKNHSIITGGSIASMLLGETINDFDYYLTDKDSVELVAKYYVDKFNLLHPDIDRQPSVRVDGDRVKIWVQSAGSVSENGDDGYQYFESLPDEAGMEYVDRMLSIGDETEDHLDSIDSSSSKYRPVFLSANAITLSDKVQIVIRFYGEPDAIHRNYDFAHCCNYWVAKTGELVLNPKAMESLLSKNLQYQGSLYPVCSVIRARKFLSRGWFINAGQYLKMCFQISELDLTNIEVLEEQLTGVDAAYFHQVIEYCKKRMSEDENFKVTTPYLVTVIDRIFG